MEEVEQGKCKDSFHAIYLCIDFSRFIIKSKDNSWCALFYSDILLHKEAVLARFSNLAKISAVVQPVVSP